MPLSIRSRVYSCSWSWLRYALNINLDFVIPSSQFAVSKIWLIISFLFLYTSYLLLLNRLSYCWDDKNRILAKHYEDLYYACANNKEAYLTRRKFLYEISFPSTRNIIWLFSHPRNNMTCDTADIAAAIYLSSTLSLVI